MITTLLVLASIVAMVLSPLLVPAIITAAHTLRGTNRPATTVGNLRPALA